MISKFEEWLDVVGLKHEPHQKAAVDWCLQREKTLEHKGGIIADEMGLGKTIEILGTIHCNPLKNTLIVLPYSLLGQWVDIIKKLFNFTPFVYHGSQRKQLTLEYITSHPIVLTTYGLIANTRQRLIAENPLYAIKWDRIIYDEAHHLRNKKTALNSGAMLMKTDITWLMTGTPIQNSAGDLHSLYNLLGFKSTEQIKLNIVSLIAEYMLRRTKAGVGIELPACHSVNVPVTWKYTKEEKLAENIHASLSFSNITKDDEEILSGDGRAQLQQLAKAKKVCVYPKLLNNTSVNQSSKLDSVMKTILARKNNGKPKLIFCYFHAEMDELERLLKLNKMCVSKFDGRTNKQQRVKILNEPCDVLIGQIDATNEGLNLQAYKEVYIVSPHWNPAVEDQAIARCYRIGQTEEVHVFRFIMSGFDGYTVLPEDTPEAITLDQHICRVQEGKRNIVKELFANNVIKKVKKRILIYEE